MVKQLFLSVMKIQLEPENLEILKDIGERGEQTR